MAESTIRTLKIIKIMAGKSLTGMPLKAIAKAANNTPVNCHRSLADLIQEGFVIQLDNQNYALSTACLGIATAHQLEIGQAQDRINSINQRVNANAHQYL